MTDVEPAYSAGVLLLISAAAVALLLVLIMRVKLHAFVALVLISVLTAVAAGIPAASIPQALMTGFSGVLGQVALLVGFGVMVGRLLEATGGAQILADTLVGRFGAKGAPFALGVAALLFGFPIFFDAGLVVFLPIIYTVARRFGGSLLLYGLPTAAAFLAMHAVAPPHPGPVAAAELLGGNIGLTLLLALPVAVVSWFFGGYLVGKAIGSRVHADIPTALMGPVVDGKDGGPDNPPKFGTVLMILLLPLVLISCNTVIGTLQSAGTLGDTAVTQYLKLIGQTPIALLITVLVALFVLAPGRFALRDSSKMLDSALGPVCGVILITGAGGMFGGVLRASGIGEALTEQLGGLGVPLLLQAFLISAALRIAQGSATVALTTTAGLLATEVTAQGLSDVKIALVVFAIAAGGAGFSHVNDSGFWLISRFYGIDEKTTLKTWTVMASILAFTIFAVTCLVWLVV